MLDLVAHEGGIPIIAISSDGTLATTDFGETDQAVEPVDRRAPRRAADRQRRRGRHVAFPPDGSYLLYSRRTVSCAATSSTPTS